MSQSNHHFRNRQRSAYKLGNLLDAEYFDAVQEICKLKGACNG